ncbi:unnamed protein product [Arabidopsis halleri]
MACRTVSESSLSPDGPGLHHSPPKTYSRIVSPSKVQEGIDAVSSKGFVSNSVCEVKDGAIEVELPPELTTDSQPLRSKFIVGHFIGDAPHIGKVHATVKRLWSSQDKPSRIDTQFLNPKTVLFRIEDDQMRLRILRRHFWHIADIPLVVRVWSPSTATSSPDLSAIPIWVDLKHVPDSLFSHEGLKFLGGLIGSWQRLHPNTERCVCLDVARMLVVVDLEKPLPDRICLKGTKSVIGVSYPWLPSKCSVCTECEKMRKGAVVKRPTDGISPVKELDLQVSQNVLREQVGEKEKDNSVTVEEVDATAITNMSDWSLVKTSGRSSPIRPANVPAEASIALEKVKNAGSPSLFHVLSEVHEEGEIEASENEEDVPALADDYGDVAASVETVVQNKVVKSQRGRSRSRPKSIANRKDQKKSASTNTTHKASLGKH